MEGVNAALELLEQAGELENTLVVVTSDHGMPFPRAKASLYDYGSRVPLAVRWGEEIPGGRVVDDFVSLSDLAPTFLEAAGLEPAEGMTARSLLPLLASSAGGRVEPERDAAFIAMERHDGCRRGGKGYPCRAIRTASHLYIRNFEPTRWPSGSPDAKDCARGIPYGEIDSSPTKTLMMESRGEPGIDRLAELSFGTRPENELYDLRSDPGQLNNLAGQPSAQQIVGAASRSADGPSRGHRRSPGPGPPRALGLLPLLRSESERGLGSRSAAGLELPQPPLEGETHEQSRLVLPPQRLNELQESVQVAGRTRRGDCGQDPGEPEAGPGGRGGAARRRGDPLRRQGAKADGNCRRRRQARPT